MSKKAKKAKKAAKPDVWDGMTGSQWDDLGEYVRWVADQLGLRDWTFTLDRLPITAEADRDAWAMVTAIYGQRHARIQFCHDWCTLGANVRRKCVVHELLHCHVNQIHILLQNQLPSMLGDAGWEPVNQGVRYQTEHIVDAIAVAVAPLLPVPLA